MKTPECCIELLTARFDKVKVDYGRARAEQSGCMADILWGEMIMLQYVLAACFEVDVEVKI